MKHVPIKEAQERLEELVAAVQAGEEVVLTLNGEALAEISLPRERRGGLNREALRQWKQELGVTELVEYISEDFDDPLPEDFLITPEH